MVATSARAFMFSRVTDLSRKKLILHQPPPSSPRRLPCVPNHAVHSTVISCLRRGAAKCRELVGVEAASKSGQFTFLNCFDMSSGTVASAVKEGVKLYFYNIRSTHVEKARNIAIEKALHEALVKGMAVNAAAKDAQNAGAKAAKLATRQAKRIIRPIVAAEWDFFEALYFGGSLTEGFLSGSGTLVGAYSGGYVGEQRFGRFGYLVGRHLSNWIGARVGLMVYDVVNGVNFFLDTYQYGESYEHQSTYENSEDQSTYEIPELRALEASWIDDDQKSF